MYGIGYIVISIFPFVVDGPVNYKIIVRKEGFECHASCNPPCNYSWYHTNVTRPVHEGSVLEVANDVLKADQIMCQAHNYVGRVNVSMHAESPGEPLLN